MTSHFSIEIEGNHDFCEILRAIKKGDKITPDVLDQLEKFRGYRRLFEIMKNKKDIKMKKKAFLKHITKAVRGNTPIFFKDSIIRWMTISGMIRGTYRYTAQHIDEIQIFIDNLYQHQTEVLDDIHQRIRKYIPSHVDLPHSTIYPIFCWGDSTYTENEMFVDATYAYISGMENIKGNIAHELHHVARYNYEVTTGKFKPQKDSKYGLIIDWMESLHGLKLMTTMLENEGLANMVWSFKQYDLMKDFPIYQFFVSRVKEASLHIEQSLKAFDEMLRKSYPKEPRKSKINRLVGGIARNPIAHYMANNIEKSYGVQQLTETFGNPLEFINMYQQSAKKGNGVVFSNQSIRLIENAFSP